MRTFIHSFISCPWKSDGDRIDSGISFLIIIVDSEKEELAAEEERREACYGRRTAMIIRLKIISLSKQE